MLPTVLNTDQLCLSRGEHLICRALDLTVRAGELLMLTGPNGVGKTSLLRVLAGLVSPDGGAVRWQESLLENGNDTDSSAFLYLSHQSALRPELTVYENLFFYAELRNPSRSISRSMIINQLAYFKLESHADTLCGKLSEGQRQRTALTRLLTEKAALWLLDEPSSALDREGMQLLDKLLIRHLENDGAAVVATHRPITLPQSQLTQLQLPC